MVEASRRMAERLGMPADIRAADADSMQVEGAPLRFDVDEDEGTLTIRVLQLGSEPSLTREDLAELQAAVQEALAVPDEGTGIAYESIDDAHADRRGRLVTLA